MTEGLIYIVVAVGLFFILRTVWLWYWRVNEVVDLLSQINSNLKILVLEKPSSAPSTAPVGDRSLRAGEQAGDTLLSDFEVRAQGDAEAQKATTPSPLWLDELKDQHES